MRVHFNGLSYFGQKLVSDLTEFDNENTYLFYDTYKKKWEKVRFRFGLRKADLVVSFNGVTSLSGSLDLVVKKRKPLVMYWHGTDVIKALKRKRKGSLVKKYIEHAVHFTDAKWLKEELATIGIQAELVPFKFVEAIENKRQYSSMRVLVYLGQGKEPFYGLSTVRTLAENNPEVDFVIVGSDGKGIDSLPNMQFKGWCSAEEMRHLRLEIPIFLRCTKHDGNALSVLEALASGMEVLWNYPAEHCHLAQDNLTDVFDKVKRLVEQRDLMPNQDNINFVSKRYNKDEILANFVSNLKKQIHG